MCAHTDSSKTLERKLYLWVQRAGLCSWWTMTGAACLSARLVNCREPFIQGSIVDQCVSGMCLSLLASKDPKS